MPRMNWKGNYKNCQLIFFSLLMGNSLLGAVQLAGAPMWPLQRPLTTDENNFLRMTDWRSIYKVNPTRDKEFAF
ncbi:hypothetical protein J6590_063878 [Homalodisca vitripennis]|nr:hypothetical protein J6590_063878 [Homalodisca vitripennis]